jgi:hypothetical protein
MKKLIRNSTAEFLIFISQAGQDRPCKSDFDKLIRLQQKENNNQLKEDAQLLR